MKKLLTLLLALALAFSFASCKHKPDSSDSGSSSSPAQSSDSGSSSDTGSQSPVEPPHTHSGSEWLFDEDSHWKVCDVDGETFNKSAHDGAVCSVCGVVTEGTEGLEFAEVHEEDSEAVIGYSVTGIGEEYRNESSARLLIPSYHAGKPVISVGEEAFAHPSNKSTSAEGKFISSVIVGNGVKEIQASAFRNCGLKNADDSYGGLTDVTLPDSVELIDDNAFYHLFALNDVALPASLKEIGMNAFDSCYGLTSVVLPEGLEHIGNGVFSKCSNLAEIKFGPNITSIGSDFLNSTAVLKNAVYDEMGLFIIDGYIIDCDGECTDELVLDNLKMADGAISRSAYSTVTFSEGIEEIPNDLFGRLNATTINLPVSLKSIGHNVFANNSNLTTINYAGTPAQWKDIELSPIWNLNSNAFTIKCDGGDLYVISAYIQYPFSSSTNLPAGSVSVTATVGGEQSEYKSSNGWIYFVVEPGTAVSIDSITLVKSSTTYVLGETVSFDGSKSEKADIVLVAQA